MNQVDAQVNPNKLFVGNISFGVSEAQLAELFSQYGEIKEVKMIMDRFSGRPKGIAFVEYTEESAAQAAVEALNGFEFDGRALVVNVARPLQPRPQGGRPDFRRGGNGGGRDRGFGRDHHNRD